MVHDQCCEKCFYGFKGQDTCDKSVKRCSQSERTQHIGS